MFKIMIVLCLANTPADQSDNPQFCRMFTSHNGFETMEQCKARGGDVVQELLQDPNFIAQQLDLQSWKCVTPREGGSDE